MERLIATPIKNGGACGVELEVRIQVKTSATLGYRYAQSGTRMKALRKTWENASQDIL